MRVAKRLGVALVFVVAASCGDDAEIAPACGLDWMGVCHCTAPQRFDPTWQPVPGCNNYPCCFYDLDLNNGDCFCVNVLSSLDPNERPILGEKLDPPECLRRVPVRHARVIPSCTPPGARPR